MIEHSLVLKIKSKKEISEEEYKTIEKQIGQVLEKFHGIELLSMI